MAEHRLSGILHSVAKRVRADFEESRAFQHRGEAGTVRQAIVQDFLRRYLPRHVDVANSAEIITADGDVSSQCDIAFFDHNTPPLLDMESYRKLPNEGVYGVMEVKTKLDKTQLLDACNKVAQAKALAKRAYRWPKSTEDAPEIIYGKFYRYFPTVGMIFAFDSTDLSELGKTLLEWCATKEAQYWPDSIWVLGKGCLTWTSSLSDAMTPRPEPGSGLLAVAPEVADEDILFAFVLYLNEYFTNTWMPPLRLTDYAGEDGMGIVLRVLKQPHYPNPTSRTRNF